MTLVPHHCWNTAMTMPITAILLSGLLKSVRSPWPLSLVVAAASSMPFISQWAYPSPPIRVRMLFALSFCPVITSHRGLSGMRTTSKRNAMAGNAPAQNIHLHPIWQFHVSMPFVVTGSAISQLVICAASIPSTMVSWLSDTSFPRMFAGATSAIYIGDRPEAMPMPTPLRKRAARNRPKVLKYPVAYAETMKMMAAVVSNRLRPSLSARVPAVMAPVRQPTRAMLIASPCICGFDEMSKYTS